MTVRKYKVDETKCSKTFFFIKDNTAAGMQNLPKIIYKYINPELRTGYLVCKKHDL